MHRTNVYDLKIKLMKSIRNCDIPKVITAKLVLVITSYTVSREIRFIANYWLIQILIAYSVCTIRTLRWRFPLLLLQHVLFTNFWKRLLFKLLRVPCPDVKAVIRQNSDPSEQPSWYGDSAAEQLVKEFQVRLRILHHIVTVLSHFYWTIRFKLTIVNLYKVHGEYAIWNRFLFLTGKNWRRRSQLGAEEKSVSCNELPGLCSVCEGPQWEQVSIVHTYYGKQCPDDIYTCKM